ncbi:MAG: hypothetical protein ABSA58_14595 [Acetobacteraceae bacterium]|jgi:hypothetical protein
MRGVSMLVRLAQQDLEERRSDLGCLNRAREDTETEIGAHDAAVTTEATIAMADPASLAMFSAWASQSARGRARLQDRFAELDAGASAARDSLRDAAAQVRRLEIVVETVSAKARRVSVRQADAKADERELAHYAQMVSHR